jgi:hypothetical protein
MRACSILRQQPLHQKRNNDQDDNRGREKLSASTLVSIDTATRTALHDLVQAPSTQRALARMIAMLHAALAAEASAI